MTGPSQRSRRRGPEFERQVADYFKEVFPYADRRVRTGARDTGDVGGIPRFVIEVKAPGPGKPLNLAEAMREAEVEARNAGVTRFAAVIKRTRKGVADSYAVVPLWLLRGLIETQHRSETDR